MLAHELSLQEISHVIALATAPAFLLTGVVALLGLLASRLSGVADRARLLADIEDSDASRAQRKSDLPKLRRQARWINGAMALSVLSGLLTSLLVVIAFLSALSSYNAEVLIASMFVIALLAFMAALFCFVCEVMIGLTEFHHYA